MTRLVWDEKKEKWIGQVLVGKDWHPDSEFHWASKSLEDLIRSIYEGASFDQSEKELRARIEYLYLAHNAKKEEPIPPRKWIVNTLGLDMDSAVQITCDTLHFAGYNVVPVFDAPYENYKYLDGFLKEVVCPASRELSSQLVYPSVNICLYLTPGDSDEYAGGAKGEITLEFTGDEDDRDITDILRHFEFYLW